MSKSVQSLAGVWSLEKARGQTIEGKWIDETVIGGTGVMTPDGKITAFMKTSEYTLGFTGTYTFDGKTMRQTTKASTNPEFEARVIEREMTFIEPNILKLSAVDEVTGLAYELSMRRTNDVI